MYVLVLELSVPVFYRVCRIILGCRVHCLDDDTSPINSDIR
jgi:hypothetical protein